MAKKVVMEALSPTMEEGRLVTWHRHEGDTVKTGDTIAEVETDKAVMELVARAEGTLLQLVVAEGQTVPVGDVVAFIGEPGESVPAAASTSASPAAAPEQPPPSSAAVPTAESDARDAAAPPPEPAHQTDGRTTRVKASPLARRLARDRQIDLTTVQGSGPGGRVIKRDIEAFVALPAPSVAIAPGAAYEDVPISQMRKTIAKRLAQSIGPIPTFYLTAEPDMERVAEAREALNAGSEVRISFNDVILKATALALVKHPSCNAWWQDTSIRRWRDVHLGVAVAVDEGLVTPIIRHADRKSLAEIATESRALAERARARKLQPEEYTGATFSVSNLGMFDIDDFTAVINPPEAGILAIGRVVAKPVVVDGTVVVRRRMRITMSCDHRVIDGATGATFLQTLVAMLENPLAMLL